MKTDLHNVNTIIPIIDLFAGPGGLGEGFSAFKSENLSFQIRLSIEQDPTARETLKLRSFFRKSTLSDRASYYDILRDKLPISSLYDNHPDIAREADNEAWCISLNEDNAQIIHQKIAANLGGNRRWVLIGGPPCQAYSLVGRSRNRAKPGYRAEDDNKHTLYREYLDVIARHQPAAFVMENVKGLLSSKLHGERIFDQILADLKNPIASLKYRASELTDCPQYKLYSFACEGGTSLRPSDFVLKMENYGIPQARHRVIILGVREDIEYAFEPLTPGSLVAQDVLLDLPKLRSGVSKALDGEKEWVLALLKVRESTWYSQVQHVWPKIYGNMESTLQSISSPHEGRGSEFVVSNNPQKPPQHHSWYIDENIRGYYNHSTRSHILPDLHRYFFASSFARIEGRSPKLSEYPKELLPKHQNINKLIFEDRFRVQLPLKPSTTITSHISKDGHYYIHYDPAQCRSLTVREAARLQTFPDNYFFCGPRTEQYRQVGNAVPPLLAREIARVVAKLFS